MKCAARSKSGRQRARQPDDGLLGGRALQLPEEATLDIRRRLRRIAGQVTGVERMLAEGRDCREVMEQLAAATRALEHAGFRLVAAGLAYCIDHPEEAEASGGGPEVVEKMLMTLR
jgi:DNA-binding FrmR family transcriptional regulator